jgi:hypothetical protein
MAVTARFLYGSACHARETQWSEKKKDKQKAGKKRGKGGREWSEKKIKKKKDKQKAGKKR